MQHDHAFTSAVVNEIIKSNGIPEIICFKSDNFSTQYKCKWIFQFWNNLAKKLNTQVIIYYGITGHGKGLVDAMSAFGVKSPLSRAVITKNLHYNSAEDIHQYLSYLFKDDKTKFHTILASVDNESFKNNNSHLIIKGCRKLHMLSFFLMDPSSQRSTYVLVNPVSKVILFLA